jgi:protein O-GlcNAc transferase
MPQIGAVASQQITRGMQAHNRERLARAEAACRSALRFKPHHPELLHNLGLALQELGKLEEAAATYRQAIALKPDLREAHFNLGLVLYELGRPDEAVTAYRCGLPFMRSNAELHYNLGNALRDLGRQDEAVACYRRAIALKPAFAEAYTNLGAILRGGGKHAEATAAFRRACSIDPNSAGAWNNLGLALYALGEHEEAAASHRRSVALSAEYADAHINLGIALQALGDPREAVAAYRHAIAAKPDDAAAYNNLGTILLELGTLDQALAAFRQAIGLDPSAAGTHNNLGLVLQGLGRLDEAVASFELALAYRPDFTEAFNNLTYVRRTLCDWRDLERDAERCRSSVRSGKTGHDPLAFISLNSTLEEQQRCARSWTRAKTTGAPRLPPCERKSTGKIRLGYLSADFRQHSVAVLTAELFERHDRSRFEVIAYSSGRDDGSAMRRRLCQAFDRFVDIAPLTHHRAAQLIRNDAIDILVDLSGHTNGARLPIVAARPAPIQVNFLGYPGTMGADCIDYVIADPIIAPMTDQPFYDERIVHLPDCYMPFDTTQAIAEPVPTRTEYGLPEAGFVFCCFNNTQKITPTAFDVWMKLLLAVPGSVLWLAEEKATVRANLVREAEARGVAAERLVFARMQPLPEHLARHRLADLFLDTLPYNACTTTGLALWAGLPVLTCLGNGFAGRIAASLLHAVGLQELVTRSSAEYEALALRLAADRAQLEDLRRRLAANRLTAPLFDTGRYARNIEAAYLRFWQNWAAGMPPQAFSVNGAE